MSAPKMRMVLASFFMARAMAEKSVYSVQLMLWPKGIICPRSVDFLAGYVKFLKELKNVFSCGYPKEICSCQYAGIQRVGKPNPKPDVNLKMDSKTSKSMTAQ